jgi:hypothetical protein
MYQMRALLVCKMRLYPRRNLAVRHFFGRFNHGNPAINIAVLHKLLQLAFGLAGAEYKDRLRILYVRQGFFIFRLKPPPWRV